MHLDPHSGVLNSPTRQPSRPIHSLVYDGRCDSISSPKAYSH